MRKHKKKIVGIVLAIIFFNATLLIYTVTDNSMSPIFRENTVGLSLRLYSLNRFDVVILEVDNTYYIRRIVGLPNEKIVYNDKLYVNDEVVEDEHHRELSLDVELNDDEYLCLSDNTNDYLIIKGEQILSKSIRR